MSVEEVLLYLLETLLVMVVDRDQLISKERGASSALVKSCLYLILNSDEVLDVLLKLGEYQSIVTIEFVRHELSLVAKQG